MSGVRHTAGHHPGPRPAYVEKRRLAFPPRIVLVPQRGQTLPAVFLLTAHEFQPDFLFWQWRRAHVDTEHRSKPGVLADTLMHHMLMETTPARIGRVGAYRQILVGEHAPGAN